MKYLKTIFLQYINDINDIEYLITFINNCKNNIKNDKIIVLYSNNNCNKIAIINYITYFLGSDNIGKHPNIQAGKIYYCKEDIIKENLLYDEFEYDKLFDKKLIILPNNYNNFMVIKQLFLNISIYMRHCGCKETFNSLIVRTNNQNYENYLEEKGIQVKKIIVNETSLFTKEIKETEILRKQKTDYKTIIFYTNFESKITI